MATEDRTIITGIVKNGVIVPQAGSGLPEGLVVNIVVPEQSLTPQLAEELAAWQQAGIQTWAMIDEWEREGQ